MTFFCTHLHSSGSRCFCILCSRGKSGRATCCKIKPLTLHLALEPNRAGSVGRAGVNPSCLILKLFRLCSLLLAREVSAVRRSVIDKHLPAYWPAACVMQWIGKYQIFKKLADLIRYKTAIITPIIRGPQAVLSCLDRFSFHKLIPKCPPVQFVSSTKKDCDSLFRFFLFVWFRNIKWREDFLEIQRAKSKGTG